MPIETRFNCLDDKNDYLTVESVGVSGDGVIIINGVFMNEDVKYTYDIPTAIKLSKTIRTHINKVKGI